jgi:transcriptional regulator with XRE-family HTH domain
MLTPPPEPAADVFCRAYRAGLVWKDVLRRAGVGRSTWWRIEHGADFRNSTIEKLSAATDELIAEAAPAPDPDPDPATMKETQAHGC